MARKIGRGVAEFSALGLAAVAAGAAYLLSAPVWVLPLAAVGAWSTVKILLIPPSAPSKPAKPLPGSSQGEYDASIADVAQASQHILTLSGRAADPLVRQRGVYTRL